MADSGSCSSSGALAVSLWLCSGYNNCPCTLSQHNLHAGSDSSPAVYRRSWCSAVMLNIKIYSCLQKLDPFQPPQPPDLITVPSVLLLEDLTGGDCSLSQTESFKSFSASWCSYGNFKRASIFWSCSHPVSQLKSLKLQPAAKRRISLQTMALLLPFATVLQWVFVFLSHVCVYISVWSGHVYVCGVCAFYSLLFRSKVEATCFSRGLHENSNSPCMHLHQLLPFLFVHVCNCIEQQMCSSCFATDGNELMMFLMIPRENRVDCVRSQCIYVIGTCVRGIVERRECLNGRKEMEEGPWEERGTACQRIAR